MNFEEEIWSFEQELFRLGKHKEFQVVVYLGEREWREFHAGINWMLQHKLRDDDLAGGPMMFRGAQIFRIVAPSHRHITTISIK